MSEGSGGFEDTEGLGSELVGSVRSLGQQTGSAKPGTGGPVSERSGIVTARGTADGLVLRLDGELGFSMIRRGLWEYIESRRHFVEGNELILEWTGDAPDESFVLQLREDLIRDFAVRFKAARNSRDVAAVRETSSKRGTEEIKVPSLFDGIEALGFSSVEAVKTTERATASRASTSSMWDDADSRIVYGTLRSGQKIETEHSAVIFGDVNSGAEIVAGGDVVVLGFLRGIAHAGAYDETGGGRVIFALNLQPTQLRIGSVISRGAASEGYAGAELARVDGNTIVVEPYQSKGAPLPRTK